MGPCQITISGGQRQRLLLNVASSTVGYDATAGLYYCWVSFIMFCLVLHSFSDSSEEEKRTGLVRDLNPGPLAPEARIIPLDQRAGTSHRQNIVSATTSELHFPTLVLRNGSSCNIRSDIVPVTRAVPESYQLTGA